VPGGDVPQRRGAIEVDVALAILHEVLRQADVDDTCHEPGCDKPAKWIPESKRLKDRRALICPDGHRHHSSVVNVPMREVKDLYWIVVKWASENSFDVSHLVEVERRLEATVRYPNPKGGFVERTITGQLDAWLLDAQDASHAIVWTGKTRGRCHRRPSFPSRATSSSASTRCW
jgi:hypothetical protein